MSSLFDCFDDLSDSADIHSSRSHFLNKELKFESYMFPLAAIEIEPDVLEEIISTFCYGGRSGCTI